MSIRAATFVLSHVIPNENLQLEDFARGESPPVVKPSVRAVTLHHGFWHPVVDVYLCFLLCGVAGAGPLVLHVVSPTTQVERVVASHNIRTNTGTVHALQYNFTLFEF